MIKPHDHAAPDVDTTTLNPMHALKERTGLRPHILMFLVLEVSPRFRVSIPMKTF